MHRTRVFLDADPNDAQENPAYGRGSRRHSHWRFRSMDFSLRTRCQRIVHNQPQRPGRTRWNTWPAFLRHIVHDIKIRKPRSYGLLVLGIACGIFLQAIVYFKNPCPDDCHTDFVLKLGACVILMVDGFGNFYRKS
jgi:hypothetical protein